MGRFIFALIMFVSISVEAQVQRYSLPTVSRKLLKIKEGLPAQNLSIEGSPTSPEAAALIRHYKDVIYPQLLHMQDVYQKYSALHVLIDSASYTSKRQLKRWKEDFNQIMNEVSAIEVDSRFMEDVIRWKDLARNLQGDLPDYARNFAEAFELQHFSEDMRPLLTEVMQIHNALEGKRRTSPAARSIKAYRSSLIEIPRLFKEGKISFQEAADQIEKVHREIGGDRLLGYQAVNSMRDEFNRMAVLRTKLAQSKGFRTWADYQLEASGVGYLPEYRGTANQRAFLEKWIDQMKPIFADFVKRRSSELGLDPTQLRHQHLSLLTPPDLSTLQPYLPASNLTDIWETAMLESGFPAETLSQIIVDDRARKGKNPSGAYLSPIVMPEPSTLILDAATLNFKASDLKPGLMYVLQTYRGSGHRDLLTAFHEGMGHALEYLLKGKEVLIEEPYGYVEVPSMTAEHFTLDPEFLFANLVPVNGHKPSLDEIRRLAKNSQISSIVRFISLPTQALFDTEIWDYDYTAPNAKTYTERIGEVTSAIDERLGALPSFDLEIPSWWTYMSTSHFTSGAVRNIGYSYAFIASEMMAQYISEELQHQTGRSSWFQQPGLANLIINQFYKQGWKLPFPSSIEQITGRPYDVQTVIDDFKRKMECEDLLTE